MILHMYKIRNYNANTSSLRTYNTWNNLTYTLHIPLKHHILHLKHVNTQRKFYQSTPLHTYTSNFATSSTLQEMLLAYKLNSNNPPFAHLFELIIFELCLK